MVRDCDTAPTTDEYAQLEAATCDFYRRFLSQEYASTFYNVNVSVKKAAFQTGIPSEKYNVYVEWNVQAQFYPKEDETQAASLSPSKSDNNRRLVVPDNFELCRALVQSLRSEYLTDHICALRDTCFARAKGVFMEQVVKYSNNKGNNAETSNNFNE